MDGEPKFEAALERIEQIVDGLERGEAELSGALAKYEEGVKLLSHCYGLLDQAERAVALLAGVDDQGNPVVEPFDATATAERGDAPGRRRAEVEDVDRLG